MLQADGSLKLVSVYGVGEQFVNAINTQVIPMDGSAVGQAIQSRKPVQIPDIYQDDSYLMSASAQMENIHAILALPLLRGKDVIGGIVIWQRQPCHFTTEEEVFLQALANQSVNAIQNARLFAFEQDQRKLAEVLREISAVLSATLDLNSLLDILLVQAARLVKYDAAKITLVEGNSVRVACMRGYEKFDPEYAQIVKNMHLEIARTPNLCYMYESHQPLVIPDINQDPTWIKIAPDIPVRSWVGAPIVVQDKVLAFFALDSILPNAYLSEHADLLALLAGQAGMALHNARLYDEARHRAIQQEALSKIIATAVTANDLQDLLGKALNVCLDATRLEMGGLWIHGQYALRGLPDDVGMVSTQYSWSTGNHLSATLMVEDWSQLAAGDPLYGWVGLMVTYGVRSSLVVPVSASGQRIGGLSLASCEPRHWSNEEIALVEAIGQQLGSAAERLDLLAKTQAQARQVQQILDTVPEGVILLDDSQRIVVANPVAEMYFWELAACALADIPLVKLAGKPIGEFLEASAAETWQELQLEVDPARSARPKQGAVSRRERKMRQIFEYAVRPVEIRSGWMSVTSSGGWVLVFRDVTRERENLNHAQMQERLATVGQLAAGIAHDFNNIMATILIYTDLITMEANLPPSTREQMSIIQQQIHRAASLIRQILDFSRRTVMEQTVLDLLPFIKELDKMMMRVLPENIQMKLSYRAGEYIVRADPTRLQQSLMNLILNSRDAMPDGGTLQILLEHYTLEEGGDAPAPDLQPGRWIRLTVGDSGSGIAAEIMPFIFDPFFTTKPVGKGTGLGLSQVYGIIQQHQGCIDIHSVLGKGTTVTIYLPEFALAAGTALSRTADTHFKGNGETILLVEDDEIARGALQSLLETHNFRVLIAENGIQALEIFEHATQGIKLVISDLVMPEMGGAVLYQKLSERYPQVKVVFITGYPLDKEDKIVLEKSQVRWLQKPFMLQEFLATIRSML
jgi:signal transduction histidine kinase/CheY-like chemotaxis protein